MMNAPSNVITRTLLILMTCVLASCGGGSSGGSNGTSSSTAVPDTTPDAIAFTASTNAATSAAVTSPAVTVSGIDAEASVSISGGEYSINGGAFTSAAGKISNGQSLVVRVTASDKTNTAKSATITVGGVSATFSVTTLADVTPASFTLAPVTNAALGATVTSAAVTLSGFDIAVPVSITGGEYSINGGAFTSTAGTVSAAQSVAVKLVASANHSTTTTAQLTVGGVSASFSVTTLPDSTPDAFSFTAKTGAAINTAYTSDAVTVKGIDTAVAISITGGEYSVNSGAFTAAAGTVSVNDTVSVKATAANGTELTREAVLTIGGVTGTYSITTVMESTPPVAEFKFPTPYTMSEANSVKVRGTATDEHAITSVKLVVGATEIPATPKSETNGVKDFSSWTATVPLTASTENEIKVIATDDRNNTTVLANANKVTVRQADVAEAFPDEVNQFVSLPKSIVLDKSDDRNRLLVNDHGDDVIYSVNLDTGSRSLFTQVKDDDCSNHADGTILDSLNNKLYAFCNTDYKYLLEYNLISGELEQSYLLPTRQVVKAMALDRNSGRNQIVFATHIDADNIWEEENGGIYAFELDSKIFSTISTNLNQQIPIAEAMHIAVNGDQYLLTTGGIIKGPEYRKIISVDALTGDRRVLSSNAVGSGELFRGLLPDGLSPQLMGMYVQPQFNRILVVEYGGKIFSIDLSTGNRSVFKLFSYGLQVSEDFAYTQQIEPDESSNIAYIDDNRRNAILILDLETLEKVILSKSKNNF